MVKYDEAVIKTVLSLFREYCRTDEIKLSLKDKESLMEGIDVEKFRCMDDRYGLLAYDNWALPIFLNEHPTMDTEVIGEGLNKESRVIFENVRVQTFAYALADIYCGDVPDKAIMYAAMVESGHAAGVLPKLHRRRHRAMSDTSVDYIAANILAKRVRDGNTQIT